MYQKQEGFAIDAAESFIKNLQFVADNTKSNGGEIKLTGFKKCFGEPH